MIKNIIEQNKIVSIIPARGGSERIPDKNLLKFSGKPLIAHSIDVVNRLGIPVFVTTDDERIENASIKAGAEVIRRPKEISHGHASSESALIHAITTMREEHNIDPDLVIFLQCTSPIRTSNDIRRALALFDESKADSLFSATPFNKLIWEIDKGGNLNSINWNYENRIREQDMSPQFQENGSIYIFKPWVLEKYQNRLGGKTVMYEMAYWRSFQIDEPQEVKLLEWINENFR